MGHGGRLRERFRLSRPGRGTDVRRRVTGAAIVIGAWGVVLAVGLGLALVADLLAGRHPALHAALGDLGLITLLWAAGTPAILWAARRWPVRAGPAVRHILVHAALGGCFVVTLNAAIRLRLLVAGGPDAFAADLLLGLARHGPTALLAYAVVVAIGHVVAGPRTPAGSLVAQNGRETVVIASDEIEWIEARGNYARIYTRGGARLVRRPISALEAALDPVAFMRIHRTAIVALRAVRELRPRAHGDRTVVLRDGRELPLTRSRRKALEALLSAR
jgi:LytTr DNA-binding domain